MNSVVTLPGSASGNTARYAQMVRSSKKTEWQIDRDLLQDRSFDFSRKFLPDGLSQVDRLTFLDAAEARLLSQIQGPDLRVYLWPGRAFHQCQDARSGSGPCV